MTCDQLKPLMPHPDLKMLKAHGSPVLLEEDRPVALDDPEVPAVVREAVQRDAQPGDVLWRCVRKGAPTGPLAVLGWGHRPLVVAWWPQW